VVLRQADEKSQQKLMRQSNEAAFGSQQVPEKPPRMANSVSAFCPSWSPNLLGFRQFTTIMGETDTALAIG
jgi:hypothetical protein